MAVLQVDLQVHDIVYKQSIYSSSADEAKWISWLRNGLH